MKKLFKELMFLCVGVLIMFLVVKVLSKIYLLYYPHAFVWQYFSVLKYWFVVIIFIFSFGNIRNFITIYYKKSRIIFLCTVGLLVIVSLGFFSWKGQLNLKDDTEYYETGFDQLTYYSWSRDILLNKNLFVEPTVIFSKPFFLYIKSLEMWLFGDGTLIVDTFNVWLMLLLPVLLCFTVLLQTNDYKINRRNIVLWFLLLVIFVFWYLVFNGWFVRFTSTLSEMPSWFFMGLATVLLFTDKFRYKNVYILILLSLSLLMRTTIVVYFPIYFFLLYISNTEKLTKLFVTLCLVVGTLIVLHALIGVSDYGAAIEYFIYNTETKSSGTATSIFQKIKWLVPSGYELIVWFQFGISLIFVYFKNKKIVLYSILVVLFTLFLEIFLMSPIYHIRAIFWFYWMLSVLSLGLLIKARDK